MRIDTLQELVNALAVHLKKQARCAADVLSPTGARICTYRSTDGCRCGFGSLIEEKFYHPKMEGLTVDHQTVKKALILSGVHPSLFDLPAAPTRQTTSLIRDAQVRLHDQMLPHPDEDFLIHFEEQLAEFCADYNLEVPPHE